MPELPEVHTTVTYLDKLIKGKKILDVWTDYNSKAKNARGTIKDPKYFSVFKKAVTNATIGKIDRHGKNILIHLSNNHIILTHMKMTGHFLIGHYKKEKHLGKELWATTETGALADPFNKFIHLVFTLSDRKHLVLSDMRKFAKVAYIHEGEKIPEDINNLGPDPLSENFSPQILRERLLKRKNTPIKQALMDQTLIAGIGNIYSDEILWLSSIHPMKKIDTLTDGQYRTLFESTQKILRESIRSGGDSMSDYRNPLGEKGGFQLSHKAYRRTGLPCPKKGCRGIIERKIIGGRSSHFCSTHQKI